MASVIDGLSYIEIRELNINGLLNFDELTETEICNLLDDAISQFESESSDENEAFITSCLDGLDRYPKYTPEINDKQVLANILDAQKNLNRKTTFHTKKFKVLVSIAATIAIIFSMTAIVYACGYDIFDLIFNRTSETLNIEVTNNNSSQLSSSNTTLDEKQFIDKEYSDLETFLSENQNAKLPPYIPDGMEFTYGQAVIDINGETYIFTFLDETTGKDVSITTETFTSDFAATFGLEIDGVYSEQYVYSGITHYIESNYQSFSVVWFIDNKSYTLGSNLSIDEIKKIINSYYGG